MTKGKGCGGTETLEWNMEERAKVKERNRRKEHVARERETENGMKREMGEEVESRREFM